jgi:hypothetical protein
VHLDFTRIMDAVRAGEVDAGVLIHEGQLTFADEGLVLLADLGRLFAERHGGLPLPLGVNCVRMDLDPELQLAIGAAYRRSVEAALRERETAVEYALGFARGLRRELADRFVGMYVNEDSLGLADDLRRAVATIEREYAATRPLIEDPGSRRMVMTREQEIVKKCLASACFEAEVAYAEARASGCAARSACTRSSRATGAVVFPESAELEEEAWSRSPASSTAGATNTYAHTICAGPG